MIEIKDLLTSFNDIILSEAGKRESVRRAVSEVVGVEISSDKISIKNNVVYLDIKPIYKNEVFLKQDKILAKLEELLGKRTPQSIR